LRGLITYFREARRQRGHLTLAQLGKLRKLLDDRAQSLYRLADCVELDPATRIVVRRPVAELREQIARGGYADDSLADSILGELVKINPQKPKTPRELRGVAMALMRLSFIVEDARSMPRLPLPARGRHPNVLLDRLLYATARQGIADAEVARELARQKLVPDGPGSAADLAERWSAIIKSARARRRRKSRTDASAR
jgi:hypothetical protein